MSFIPDDSERPARSLRRPQKKVSALTIGDPTLAPTMQAVEAEAVEPKKKRLSRRVSFADTCLVTEFKTDGYGHGDVTAAEVSSHVCPASTEAKCPQLQQECLDRQPLLSDASIRSLLTAPLASSAAVSGDDRVTVVLHAETTDVYEQPITGEVSSSSEESRQTTGYNTKSIRGDGHSSARISTMLSDRPDRQVADATVYDMDASMQLTMCADHYGIWDGANERAAQPEAPDCTVRFCDESMEMTMAEHKPIEVRPMADCSNMLNGTYKLDRCGSPASAGSQLRDFQDGHLNTHDESEKENVYSAYGTALTADVRRTVAPNHGSSGRKETSDLQVYVDLQSKARRPSCNVAFSPTQDGSPKTLSTPDMDLTAVASGVIPQVNDREATKFGEVSMDMTMPVEALIQMGHRGERSFRRLSAASETRYFADADMSMAIATGHSLLSLSDNERLDAGSAAAAVLARETSGRDAVAIDSFATSKAVLVERPLSPAETEYAARLTAVPPSEKSDDDEPAAAVVAAVEDQCSATASTFPPHDATAVIEHSPTAVGVTVDQRSTNDTLNSVKHVSAPTAGGLGNAGHQEQSDISRAQLGATMLEGGDLLSSKDSFLVDQHGSRMLSCHSDSTRSLLDAGRSHLSAAPHGHARTGELTVELCYEETAFLLRDSIRVAVDEKKEELEEKEAELDDYRKEKMKEVQEEAGENQEQEEAGEKQEQEEDAGENQEQVEAGEMQEQVEAGEMQEQEEAGENQEPEEAGEKQEEDASEKQDEQAGEMQDEELEANCSDSAPTAGYSQHDISMEVATADLRVPVLESAKHGLANLPDDCDIIDLALTKLHLRQDEACPESVSVFANNMSALLRQLCGEKCSDAFGSSNASPASDGQPTESMRSHYNTYVIQPLEAQLRLACDQLVHHRTSLQLETETLKKQLCLSAAEPATRDSDAGALLRQVLAAGTDELPGLQEEFRSHHDRLHTVLEAKYDEWLFKCIRNIGDCWMESANLLDTYLMEINAGIGQITQKLQDGEELEKTLDAHIQMLQQKRLLEQPTTDELQRYETQQQELDKANQEVLERTKALEVLLNTKLDLGRRKDELERVYTENVQKLKLKNQAVEKPSADVTTLQSDHVSGASPGGADHFHSGAELSGLHSNSCLDLDNFRAWTLESVTADVVTVSFLDGSLTLSIALDSASATTPVDERPITNVQIQSILSESCIDAASLAVNGVMSYFNENQIANKYRGSQLIKEMLLEISSVAAHLDELVAEIMDARLRRDCVISKLHDAKSEHFVRLEVSFDNMPAATQFWLLLDFDVLLYPNATFCITFEEDLGLCRNSRHLETVASSVKPGLHYLSRLIECVSKTDASDPDNTAVMGKS